MFVDYETQERILKPVALMYRDIIKKNGIPEKEWSDEKRNNNFRLDELKRMTSMI